MGRRKIEIQPIQHDRNRSVTFLKRKNGLFKKAYELGVLCSADVAVIIFGHNSKLYEYCSTDLSALLARQREYAGERDIKGPNDFSADKADAADDDSDSAPEPPVTKVRKQDEKAKSRLRINPPSTNAPSRSGPRYAVPPSTLPDSNATTPVSTRTIKHEEFPAGGPAAGSFVPPVPPSVSVPVSSRPINSAGVEVGPAWTQSMAPDESSIRRVDDGQIPPGPMHAPREWQMDSVGDRNDAAWNGVSNPIQQAGSGGSLYPQPQYFHPPPVSQPAAARPMTHMLTAPLPGRSATLTDILAANPYLAQQIAYTAPQQSTSLYPQSPVDNPALAQAHALYSNPLFQQLLASSSQSGMSTQHAGQPGSNWPPQNQLPGVTQLPQLNFQAQPHHQQFQQPESLARSARQPVPGQADYTWLDMLSEPRQEGWPTHERSDNTSTRSPAIPAELSSAFQRQPLKRPLSSDTPLSPPESGTPHREGENNDASGHKGEVEMMDFDEEPTGAKKPRVR